MMRWSLRQSILVFIAFLAFSCQVNDLTPVLVENLRGCSIFLIGMMGSGKSTAGRMLANSLKYAFFDTDDMIEKTHKDMSVSDIFKARRICCLSTEWLDCLQSELTCWRCSREGCG